MSRAASPWLSIVGIGEDGRAGLSLAAQARLVQARLVVGGRRHLELAAPLEAETLTWPSPIAEAIPRILTRRGEPVCVLASGDPFFYGIGSMLAQVVAAEERECLPAPSSFSLAAARLGWPLQDCRLVSLHGRDLRRLVPHLQPRAKIIALTWDDATPAAIAAMLREAAFGKTSLHVLERLGGPHERIRQARADAFDMPEIDALNLVAIEIGAQFRGSFVPIAPGLPDEWFEHDGQITKREVRAMTLAALRPFRGAHLWDIGAGSGSVAIEWMLLDPANHATAIEQDPVRAARIRHNAAQLGVPDIGIVGGRAPDVLPGLLIRPDAIFIGGGTSDETLIDRAYALLPSGGTLVVNAVTIETQARLVAHHARLGGTLTQVAITHADPVGRFHGWRPAMPVTQWAVTKPWDEL